MDIYFFLGRACFVVLVVDFVCLQLDLPGLCPGHARQLHAVSISLGPVD